MTTAIFTQSFTLVQPMPGETGSVTTVYHLGDEVTDDAIIGDLVAAGAPLTFVAADFGTAAFKNVSDNVRTTVASVAGSTVTGHILAANDVNGTVQDGLVAAIRVLTSSFNTPDVNANIVTKTITIPFASLASGGSVTILNNDTEIGRYKFLNMQMNSGGTNFSGGGGNRLGQITDGTTVYSVIPAASLQTLANATWGSTALPFPASAPINTTTAAGIDLVFKYSGGTTDYTAGSLIMSFMFERVS